MSIAIPTAMITGSSRKVLVGLPVQVTVWLEPNRILQRVGKGSLDVSEQSAFEERVWDGELLRRPWPRLMATKRRLPCSRASVVGHGTEWSCSTTSCWVTSMSELKGYTSFRS
jgi:hypothetical protein